MRRISGCLREGGLLRELIHRSLFLEKVWKHLHFERDSMHAISKLHHVQFHVDTKLSLRTLLIKVVQHIQRTQGTKHAFSSDTYIRVKTMKNSKTVIPKWLRLLIRGGHLLLRFLRYLRTFRGPSWLLFFPSLDSCQICYSCDFCDICHGCFQLARKILVIFAIFADISWPFLVSSFSKYGILLNLLFLRFLRYL